MNDIFSLEVWGSSISGCSKIGFTVPLPYIVTMQGQSSEAYHSIFIFGSPECNDEMGCESGASDRIQGYKSGTAK